MKKLNKEEMRLILGGTLLGEKDARAQEADDQKLKID